MLNDKDIEILHEKIKKVQDSELQQLVLTLIKENLNLKRVSNTDPLTGLYNRRILDEIKSKSLPIIAVMCDVDNFKEINDTYGHDKGDYVIQSIGHILKMNSRNSDYICRLGGDEFLLIFTDYSDSSFIFDRCNKIKTDIAETIKLPNHNVTLSMGVAIDDSYNKLDDVIKKADESLYRSKNQGKNQVTFYEDNIFSSKHIK